MFERFTERARGVLADAQRLASERQSPAIRRHHILVALISAADDGSGSVAAVLDDAGVDREALRTELLASLAASETPSEKRNNQPPFTAETKKALELGLREALSLGHNYIGREHLLLGVLRDPEGPLAEVLAKTKLEHSRARAVVAEQSPPSERRGRRMRIRDRGPRGQRASAGAQKVLERAFKLAGNARDMTTGDLLLALADTPGTHFATLLESVTLPDREALKARLASLVDAKTPDGVEDAVKVDASGAVTINDPRIAEAVKKLVGDHVTPERINEILRRLES